LAEAEVEAGRALEVHSPHLSRSSTREVNAVSFH